MTTVANFSNIRVRCIGHSRYMGQLIFVWDIPLSLKLLTHHASDYFHLLLLGSLCK